MPQIGCKCPVCTSADSRDRRRRCGAYVTAADGKAFLVDTPPEMREACVEYGISKVDAVVLTHAHMDHVAGFDDLRRFNTLNGENQGTLKSLLQHHSSKVSILRCSVFFTVQLSHPYMTTLVTSGPSRAAQTTSCHVYV